MGGEGACAVLVPETCVGAVADGWWGACAVLVGSIPAEVNV